MWLINSTNRCPNVGQYTSIWYSVGVTIPSIWIESPLTTTSSRTEYNTTQIVKDRCTALLPYYHWWSTSTNQDYILQELALLVNSFFGTVVFLQLETGMGNDPIFTVLQTVA